MTCNTFHYLKNSLIWPAFLSEIKELIIGNKTRGVSVLLQMVFGFKRYYPSVVLTLFQVIPNNLLSNCSIIIKKKTWISEKLYVIILSAMCRSQNTVHVKKFEILQNFLFCKNTMKIHCCSFKIIMHNWFLR